MALPFAQRTDEAAVAALGADIRQYPEANPVRSGTRLTWASPRWVVQGRPGFVRVRTPYVRDQDVARICQEAGSLTRDPATLLPEAPRITLVSPGMERSAASERGEDKSAEAVGQVTVQNDEYVA